MNKPSFIILPRKCTCNLLLKGFIHTLCLSFKSLIDFKEVLLLCLDSLLLLIGDILEFVLQFIVFSITWHKGQK